MHSTCIKIIEWIYFPLTLIHSCHTTEDSLNLYLCFTVEGCAKKISPKKKSCTKKLPESLCPVCLEGLKFHNPAPEQQVMSTQCEHVFCYSCIVATLNERKGCPTCFKKQTIQNIHPLCLVYQIVLCYFCMVLITHPSTSSPKVKYRSQSCVMKYSDPVQYEGTKMYIHVMLKASNP